MESEMMINNPSQGFSSREQVIEDKTPNSFKMGNQIIEKQWREQRTSKKLQFQ